VFLFFAVVVTIAAVKVSAVVGVVTIGVWKIHRWCLWVASSPDYFFTQKFFIPGLLVTTGDYIREASNIFHSIMKASVKPKKVFNLERFNKEVGHIQSLYKNEIAGELSDYFRVVIENENFWLDWLKEPIVKVKNAVVTAAYKFIV
jgi:hypothetical protein